MTDLSRPRRPPHPETQALLLAAAGWGGAAGPAACRPPRADRVAELVHFAREEGLGGLLFALLRRRGLDRRLPDEARRFLEGLYHRALAGNVRRLALLEEIGRAFAARGVSAVLIQGMALLFGTYPDPGWRPVTDVDLWAPERKAAEEALRALGFAVATPRPLVLRRGGERIDLHADLLGAERVGNRRRFLPRGQSAILAACRPLAPEQPGLLRLSPHDEMLYLAFHAAKHNLARLMWLADLARLSAAWEAARWRELRERAVTLGANGLGALAAALAGNPAAGALAGEKGGLSAAARCLIRRRLAGRRLPAWAFLILLRPAGLAGRAAFVAESLFPRGAVLAAGEGPLRLHLGRAARALASLR